MRKLCRKLLLVSLSALLSLFFVFGLGTPVKAAIEYKEQWVRSDNLLDSGWTNTTGYTFEKEVDFSDCEDPFIIEASDEYQSVKYSVYFENVEFERTGLSNHFDNYDERYFVINHIIPSSDSGTLKIINTGPSNNGQPNFLFFCGVDSENPILETAFRYQEEYTAWTNGTQYDFTETNADYLHLALSFSRYYSSFSGYPYLFNPTSDFTSIYDVSRAGVLRLTGAYSSGDDEFVYPSVSGKIPDSANFYLTLNNSAGITGCAVGFQEIDGICYSIDYYNESLFFFNNPYSCNYNSTCKINYLYNENKITPYDYINIYSYATPTSTTRTFIASTTIENLSVFGKSGGQSFLTLTGTSTPSQYDYYDIETVFAEYWDANTATTVPATTSIPYVLVVDWGDYQLGLDINDFATSSTSTNNVYGKYLNLNTRDMACSQERWNSGNWWDTLGCGTLKTVLDITMAIAEIPKNFINGTTAALKTMFPFNIPVKIIKSWNDSATGTMPNGLDLLTPQDENNNIYITMSPEMAGATTSIQIWGPNIYYATDQLETIFNFVKQLTTYLLWVLCLFELIAIGKLVITEIKDEKEGDFIESDIYYNNKGEMSTHYRRK